MASRPRKSIGPYVCDWIETYCVHTIGELSGQPLILEQWQRDFIYEMFMMEWREAEPSRPAHWAYLYQSVLLMVPRGAGKSTLAAALSLFKVSPSSGEHAPRCIIAAASRDNAKHVYECARDMVHMSRPLQDFIEANKMKVWCDENRGELWRISAEGKTNFGHQPSFIVRDELHTWETDRQVTLSEALMTAIAKRRNSQALTVTTAGYDKETILGKLYDAAMRSELLENPQPGLYIVRDAHKRQLFWCYEAPQNLPIDDPETWHIAQPATWIDEDAIRAQLEDDSIGTDEFRRQWLNQWTAAKQAWFAVGVWQACKSSTKIPKTAKVQVGVDAAITGDTTAVSWCWASSADDAHVRTRVWSANPHTEHDVFVPGGRIDLNLVRDWIAEELVEMHNVTEVCYDPRFFEGAAWDLSELGFRVVPFEQASVQMADALNLFYKAVNAGRIHHNGDEVLTAHVEAAAGVETERGWKVFKLKQTKKIDACIASVMSHARARAYHKRIGATYIYTGRDDDSAKT